MRLIVFVALLLVTPGAAYAGPGHKTPLASDTRRVATEGRSLRPTPGALSDKNNDGAITVCVTGDSKMAALSKLLGDLLEQPQHVLQCARGGATALDLYNHIDNVLAGTGDRFYSCVALKGETGHPCDYVIYEIGANSFYSLPPDLPPEGVCYDNAGPNFGKPCRCDWEWESEQLTPYHCRQGLDFLKQCCPKSPVPQPMCAPRGCAGEPSGSGCDQEPHPRSWCTRGCTDSPQCPNGLCVHEPEMERHLRRQEAIMDRIRAHYSHATVVLVLPPSTYGSLYCWDRVNGSLAAIAQFYREQAAKRGYNVLDLRQEFPDRCVPVTSCYRDGVHYSPRPGGGAEVLMRLIEACLEGNTAATNARCNHL